jgi:hypothetical protein
MRLCPTKTSKIKYNLNKDRVKVEGILEVTGASTLTGATTQTGALTCAGNIIKTGANGQLTTVKQATLHVNMATATGVGTGTITLTELIPAGALLLGITARVTTILAGAALTTFSIGCSTPNDTDRFGTGIAIAAGTTVNSLTASASNFLWAQIYTTAPVMVLTAAAGVISTGYLRITAHYIDLTPATS